MENIKQEVYTDLEVVLPKTMEQHVAIYNATHTDSQIILSYIKVNKEVLELLKNKNGQTK